MSERRTDVAARSLFRKRVKALLITVAVVVALFGVLYALTENESTAPFVYAIF